LVALEPPREVEGSHGLRVAIAMPLSAETDTVVVPGGGWNDRAARGVRTEVAEGSLPAAVRDAHAHGVIAASVCTGAMILAAAGLLRGRAATTHRAALRDLEATGAALVDARIVDAGDVVTAGGVTAGIDLGLWLIARDRGRELARGIASRIEHTPAGSVWVEAERRLRPLALG
jgi:transcriptional regulator GlxA family with amidase domain